MWAVAHFLAGAAGTIMGAIIREYGNANYLLRDVPTGRPLKILLKSTGTVVYYLAFNGN
jgi:hypothetical protein